MKLRNFIGSVWLDAIALLVIGVIFIVPFIFILLTAAKTGPDAAMFRFTLPDNFQLFENIREVLEFGDGRMFLAMRNSLIITVVSITLIVLFSALVAFVMQRRRDRVAALASSIILAGLIIPPAVVPTIFLLQSIGLYRTLFGLIFPGTGGARVLGTRRGRPPHQHQPVPVGGLLVRARRCRFPPLRQPHPQWRGGSQ